MNIHQEAFLGAWLLVMNMQLLSLMQYVYLIVASTREEYRISYPFHLYPRSARKRRIVRDLFPPETNLAITDYHDFRRCREVRGLYAWDYSKKSFSAFGVENHMKKLSC